MSVIEPSIAPFIERQFPSVYRDEDPKFVAFMQTYYKWLEQTGQPLYYTRRYLDLLDVDKTTTDILVFIKEKYLKNISLDTQANIRAIIKHALDIYRSKGSERCIDLLFRLVFNEIVDFYYPKVDIMDLSGGIWYRPQYIELTLNANNPSLNHKKVVGTISGATAFVDAIIRRRAQNRLIDVAYISAIVGTFMTGEIIIPDDGSLDISLCPKMIGSLNSLTVTAQGTGTGFDVGDIVDVMSLYGEGATARILSTIGITGQLDYTLEDGGYGYTGNPHVYIAQQVITISGVGGTNGFTNGNNFSRSYLQLFDNVTQNLAFIDFCNANGQFYIGEPISTYDGNNVHIGGANILEIINPQLNVSTNTYYGGLLIGSIFGNSMNMDPFYAVSNVFSANHTPLSNGYTDLTASGVYVGMANTIVLTLTGVETLGVFIEGETIVQYNDIFPNDTQPIATGICGQIGGNSSIMTLTLSNLTGRFRCEKYNVIHFRTIHGLSSGAKGFVYDTAITIGVTNTHNTFMALPNAKVYAANGSSVVGYITEVGALGTGAQITFSNNILNTETVQYNTDLLAPFMNVALSANIGFTKAPTANLTSNSIFNCLTTTPIQIGTLDAFSFFPGTLYDFSPIIALVEPKMMDMNEDGVVLYVANTTKNFEIGGLVTQTSTGASGLIESIDADGSLGIRSHRYNSNNQFAVSNANANTQIRGSLSGANANIIAVSLDPARKRMMGRNAVMSSHTTVGDGSVISMDIINSGFGFIDGERIWFDKSGVPGVNTGYALTNLVTIGTGQGYYKEKGGFVSDSKKLYDGYYYQMFSYEIQSSKTLDKYQKLLNQLTHPAGMKMFGRIVHKSNVNTTPVILNSITTEGVNVVPDVDLNFAGNLAWIKGVGPVPFSSLLTCSRASPQTVIDSTGKVSYVGPHALAVSNAGLQIWEGRTNTCLYSGDLSNISVWGLDAGGTGSVPIVTGNYGVAPDGTKTAARVQFNKGVGTGGSSFSRVQQGPGGANVVYTDSIWIKTNDGSNTIVGMQAGPVGAVALTANSTWQRFSCSTGTATTTPNISVLLWDDLFTAATADLLVWGAQVEIGATPSPYIPTTNAASSRVADTILVSRLNLCLQSGDWSNPVYSGTRGAPGVLPVITGNFALAPDGTMTAARVQLDSGLGVGYSMIIQSISGPTAIYTDSVYLRTNDGTTKLIGLRCYDQATLLTVTGWWQRFSFTRTSPVASPDIQVLAGYVPGSSNTADLLIWGGQIEMGPSMTAYIPTTTVPATASNSLTTLLQGNAVTIMAKAGFSNVGNILGASPGPFVYSAPLFCDGTAIGFWNGATQVLAALGGGASFANSIQGAVVSWSPSGMSIVGNGGTEVTNPATIASSANDHIGGYPDGSQPLNGILKQLSFWNGQLPSSIRIPLSVT